MKAMDRFVLKTFILGLPVVIFIAFLASYLLPEPSQRIFWHETFNTCAGVVFGLWMIFAIFLSLRILTSSPFRAETLARLADFKERDEREIYLTAQAARNSFLTTLALLVLLFCLSVFRVSVFRTTEPQVPNGKTGTISLGLDLDILKSSNVPASPNISQNYFDYQGLPLSSAAVVFALIIWQIGSFKYFMRHSQNKEA